MFDGDHSSKSYRTKPHPYKDKDVMTRISAPLLILFTQREDTACQLVGRPGNRDGKPGQTGVHPKSETRKLGTLFINWERGLE